MISHAVGASSSALCLDQQYIDLNSELYYLTLSLMLHEDLLPMVMLLKSLIGSLDNENLEFSGYTLNYNINFKNFQEKIGCIYFNSG